jgi:hypothetical protein
VVAAIVTVLVVGLGTGTVRRPAGNGLVTTFLPGEFRTVPDACTAVTAATLRQYLPGRLDVVVPRSLAGRAESLCDWTLDAPPVYRHLQVTVEAYSPSGLASGDGSATFAAIDAYQQAERALLSPPRATHLPQAQVTPLPRTGDAAFTALQVIRAGGQASSLVTVVTRERNVLVTVVLEGLTGGRYGPVPVPRLRAGAAAVARDVLARLP